MKLKNKIQCLKTVVKSLMTLYVTLFLIGCQNAVVADEIPASRQNPNAQPSKKVSKDGQTLIRHAGDAWSRQKIRDFLTENKLNLNLHKSAGPTILKDICPEIKVDLHNLNFVFIEPDIITDNWSDPRLDKYKQKYKRFRYGMGYRKNYGPENPTIPTWNINIYDVDSDRDGEVEAILYGERTWARLKSGKARVKYLIFESNIRWMRGASLPYGDPSDPALGPDDYVLSALIKIQNIYAVLNVNDYSIPGLSERQIYSQVFLVGLQDKRRQGYASNSYLCYFDVNPITKSKQ